MYILTTCIVCLTDWISITISILCTGTACIVSFADYSISITITVGFTGTCFIIRIVNFVDVVVCSKRFLLTFMKFHKEKHMNTYHMCYQAYRWYHRHTRRRPRMGLLQCKDCEFCICNLV